MLHIPETFSKSERLCSKKAIANLFESGNSFYTFPFQIIWVRSLYDHDSPAQVAISVSKKNFRLAVRRNLIRRRIREAYRKNKHNLYDFLRSANVKIDFILIYKERSLPDFNLVEESIIKSMGALVNDIKKRDDLLKLS